MLMAMVPEDDNLISDEQDLSTSKDESDFPKYLNIRLDFCADDETLEFDGNVASTKFPL